MGTLLVSNPCYYNACYLFMNFLCCLQSNGHPDRAFGVATWWNEEGGLQWPFQTATGKSLKGADCGFSVIQWKLKELLPKTWIWSKDFGALSHLWLLPYIFPSYLTQPSPPPTKLQRLVFAFRAERKHEKAHSKYLVSFKNMCYSKHLQVLGFLK